MIAWSSALLVGFAAGCRDAPGDDTEVDEAAGTGFVLVGGDALAARPVLDGVAVTALPIAAPDGVARRLDSATWSIAIDAPAGVLVHAHGEDGGFDTLVIGGDVYEDRIAVRASAERVEALALALDAEARTGMDGRWLLTAEDIWARAAAVDATFAPDELQPVVIRDGLETETERSAGAGPATSGSAAAAPRALASGATGVPSVILGEVRCEDPVAGVWVATTYRTDREDWSQMTLTLGREDGIVRGTIDSLGWAGDPGDPTVPSDAVLKEDGWKVRMSARGRIAADGAFALDAVAITKRRVAPRFATGPYAMDHFTGRLVDGELLAVNNDRAYAFDRPYSFKRAACR